MKALLLILVLSLTMFAASACECISKSMGKNFKDAAFVMKVKVLSVNDTLQMGRKLEALRPPFKSGYEPNLKVLKVYKGEFSKRTLSLYGSDYCSEKYTVGMEYVLFIYQGKDSYYTRICENNFLVSDKSSMKQLRSLRPR